MAKRGRKPKPLPPGVRRRELKRHEVRIWFEDAPDDPPTLVIKKKKPIRPVGRPKMSVDRAKAPTPAYCHGHPHGAWRATKGRCVARDGLASLA
jgi:hypothetical protein